MKKAIQIIPYSPAHNNEQVLPVPTTRMVIGSFSLINMNELFISDMIIRIKNILLIKRYTILVTKKTNLNFEGDSLVFVNASSLAETTMQKIRYWFPDFLLSKNLALKYCTFLLTKCNEYITLKK